MLWIRRTKWNKNGKMEKTKIPQNYYSNTVIESMYLCTFQHYICDICLWKLPSVNIFLEKDGNEIVEYVIDGQICTQTDYYQCIYSILLIWYLNIKLLSEGILMFGHLGAIVPFLKTPYTVYHIVFLWCLKTFIFFDTLNIFEISQFLWKMGTSWQC